MQSIPKKITPCPILQAVVELRFETVLPSDAVFGILYSLLSSQYNTFEKLPILQIPEILRSQDPNLRYQPAYKLIDDNFWVQIGSNVISVVNVGSYAGWTLFLEKISSVLNHLNDSKIVSKVTRFGIRYISFFSLDIFKEINFGLTLNGDEFETEQLVLRSLLKREEFFVNLQVANKTFVSDFTEIGSIIDIDTFIENENLTIPDIKSSFLERSHFEQKKLFFGILKKEFLVSLNPEY
ncbi:MAG: TIGR04255 family protein [Pseudanabaena sp.]|jgi:uncharacterized protein (TIGR04255 family)|nr:TIGR04255 family protein [Pseudanabaena sp. M53BS1SP1A06MG]MCA6581265.1 TIGR04255 family protein [Pseudanabaena sp. M34BS1SP1A06MG]MCA6590590.1 TIGR04255 family protein [Pseudanabaena sp. M38BS1SP1A06MG]MCA6595805.1 TIGR04255 family protein [Pseudanabaena sp. M046S1SP1A06QC]MCA6601763.1 TIGR04255 family protein [Pseudanabaena sp. M57BS1SP1A06MG]MCA6603698.1 TIGR04255 family protein [Pseudanabaena sp. M007S1SP1A06QC]